MNNMTPKFLETLLDYIDARIDEHAVDKLHVDGTAEVEYEKEQRFQLRDKLYASLGETQDGK